MKKYIEKLKSLLLRVSSVQYEQVKEVGWAISQSTGKNISMTSMYKVAMDYFLKNEIYHKEDVRQKLSTMGDLRCK